MPGLIEFIKKHFTNLFALTNQMSFLVKYLLNCAMGFGLGFGVFFSFSSCHLFSVSSELLNTKRMYSTVPHVDPSASFAIALLGELLQLITLSENHRERRKRYIPRYFIFFFLTIFH